MSIKVNNPYTFHLFVSLKPANRHRGIIHRTETMTEIPVPMVSAAAHVMAKAGIQSIER